MLLTILGALLVIGGLVYIAGQALSRGRLSGPRPPRPSAPGDTLEPPARGMRFLGPTNHWPGIAAMLIGVALLFIGAGF